MEKERNKLKKKLVMKIPNISCEHCVARIEDALTEITGVMKVKGNVKKQQIKAVLSDSSVENDVKEKLSEIGYPVKE